MCRLSNRVPDPPTAKPSWVEVDETVVKINGGWSWLYAAIDLDTKLILDVALFGRHGTDRQLRSWMDSARNTISQMLSFSLINSAIELPSLD